MSKYYRFISKEEYQNLIKNEKITNINNRPLFILPEFPTAYILPEELNYNLTIEELLTSNHPRKLDFTKEIFLSYMIGTVSYDYLIELDLKKKPSMSNLGWYYNKKRKEPFPHVSKETCLHGYNKMNTKKYYKVFFFDEETKTISAQGNATFEVGRVYDKNLPLEKLEMCSNTVYHFCENIQNTWGHYDFAENCIFGEIEVLGHLLENTVNNFDIFASDKIKVRKILTWAEVISLTNADNKLHQFATKKLQYE